ncbi:NADPH-dependent F420 reductase [Kitasatospora sp. NPDC006697]|uniref:NADPH-dependent F420 reductase n=1 Tax=Kitasatospora sp. NPDC006697 TaxID=3364020 RepID=UPI0036846F85
MRIGVLGTGTVGQTLGSKLLTVGHEVMLGSRNAEGQAAVGWAEAAGPHGRRGSFAEAAEFGELVVLAVPGTVALDALAAAGPGPLAGKVLIDVTNPLVFAPDGQVTLDPVNTDSVGERIQRAHPDARVVKTLNTMAAPVMVTPSRVPGHHAVFVAGEDPVAKREVAQLLLTFGWPADSITDLGGIASARGLEMLMPFWISMMRHLGHTDFNYSFPAAA